MPKRNILNNFPNRGSALVGVVALSLIMTIGATVFISVTRSSVNQETNSLLDLQTILASESGLLIGTSWLRTQTNWNAANADLQLKAIPLNGLLDTLYPGVTVTIEALPMGNGSIQLTSKAVSANLPYNKQISWVLTRATTGNQGYFVKDATQDPGIRGTVVSGPFHTNTSLLLFNQDNGGDPLLDIFTGPVTVCNNPAVTMEVTGNSARGNNYANGLTIDDCDDCTVEAAVLDTVFQSTYATGVNKREVVYSTIVNTTTLTSGDTNVLRFGVDNDNHPYYIFNGVKTPYSATYPLVLKADFPVTVTDGSMMGIVSVKVTGGKTLTVDVSEGNIKYAGTDFNATNYQENFGVQGNNVLALIADSGTIALKNDNINNPRVITAQLFATSLSGNFDVDNGNGYTYNVVGSITIGIWWDTQGSHNPVLNLYHDRRGMAAPGVDIVEIDANGNTILKFLRSACTESNVPKKT